MKLQLANFSLFRISLMLACVLPLTASGQNTATLPIHNIVLVHGAWADGSSWSKVVPLLEKKGFT